MNLETFTKPVSTLKEHKGKIAGGGSVAILATVLWPYVGDIMTIGDLKKSMTTQLTLIMELQQQVANDGREIARLKGLEEARHNKPK